MKTIASALLVSFLISHASADPSVHEVLAKWRSAVHAGNAKAAQMESTSNEDGIT